MPSSRTSAASFAERGTTESRLAKALAHPLRTRILRRLGERVASPAEIAIELGAPLGVVAYHVRRLRDYGCVELVRTEPRRGALQHFYRATARANFDGHQWRALPSALRGELAGETLQELISDLAAAADAGTLGDPALVLSRATLELDARGWTKLNKLLAELHQQALAIATESAARDSDGKAQRVLATELGVLHFKLDEETRR